MRFATTLAALYACAVASVMSAPVDQANFGTATDGNITATVEMIKTGDGADVARITYATLDVDHPDKLAPPVTRLCWDIGPCLAALAPTIAACATAAASLGINFGADAACVAAAANTGINLRHVCDGCL